jgi:hypothetical protein
MGDGHLGKCKDCTKYDSGKREKQIRSTPEGVESERIRHREKYHRLGYKEKQIEWDKNKPWKSTTEYKGLKHRLSKKYILNRSQELHHWNYNYLSSIFVIDVSIHKKIHHELIFDADSLCFSYNGLLLDTKEKHKQFILNYLKENGIEYEVVDIDIIENKLTINKQNQIN